MGSVFEIVIGLIATVVVGLGGGRFVGQVKDWVLSRTPDGQVPMYPGVPEGVWKQILSPQPGEGKDLTGVWTGCLERLVFYAAFIADSWTFGAAWLVFKTAAKWNQWTQLRDFPLKDDGNAEYKVQRLQAVHFLVAVDHGRFILGTGYNIVAALIGVAASKGAHLALGAYGVTFM